MMNTYYFHKDPILDLFAEIACSFLHPNLKLTVHISMVEHGFTITVEEIGRRLVFDELFGYMWYNYVDGPEEIKT